MLCARKFLSRDVFPSAHYLPSDTAPDCTGVDSVDSVASVDRVDRVGSCQLKCGLKIMQIYLYH